MNRAAAELTQLTLHERFLISDPTRTAGPPSVRFANNAWLVAWTSGSREPGPARAYNVEVAKIGMSLVTQRSEIAADDFFAATLALAADGRVGVLTHRGGCTHRVFDPDLRAASAAFAPGCDCRSEGPTAASIEGSDDWLVTCRDSADSSQVIAGRYNPALADWTSMPWAVGRSGYMPINVFARGSDALVLWSNGEGRGSTARSVDELARTHGPVSSVAAADGLSLHETSAEGSGYAIAQLADRTLVIGTNGQRLWSAALSGNQVTQETDIASAAIADRAPSAAAAEERAAVGVCFATGRGPAGGSGDAKDGVSFVVLSPEGEPLLPEVAVAQDLPNIGGCAVAWSGDEFLVVYWQIDFEDLLGQHAASVIQGRRISLD